MTEMDDVLFCGEIPIPPITKKNSQRVVPNRHTGKPMIIQSDAYRKYERKAVPYLRQQADGMKPIQVPCTVTCIFWKPTRRKCDLTNHLEAVDDILVAAGILQDDNSDIIVSHDGSRVRVDKNHPRTEILVTAYLDDHKGRCRTMTQTEALLKYLRENGSCTTMEAFVELGITRLSARIWDLQKLGHQVVREIESGKTRYGNTAVYCRYRLVEDGAENIDGDKAN